MNNFVLRSLLFVPGHREKLLRKASTTKADAIILDLEDSVVPVSNKVKARILCSQLIKEGIFQHYLIFIRINDRESELIREEVRIFSKSGVTGFMFPKAFDGDDIRFIDSLLLEAERENNLKANTLKLIPIIETCSGLVHLDDICQASGRIIAIAFGCEDFITDLRGIHDRRGDSLFYPRAQIAITARANSIIPIDTVHVNVHDLEDLESNLELAKNLGFEGMLVLHPKEIELVHRYFTPSKAEVEEAQEIIRLTEIAQTEERGVALINNRFIGPPMLKKAKYILNRSKIIENWERCRE
ncbi:MAG: CoA ester lyase [Candidatus Cloacimonetes bacterium]|nr:CoA ester lyase [Candidatus Cloacimonadota bacterium]